MSTTTTAPSYAQTVTVLARQYHELAVDGEVPPSDWFRITTELHAAADAAGIDPAVADEDFAEEIQAEPANCYVG